MMDRACEMAANPEAYGFMPIGWVIRLANARYVSEVRILVPDAGVSATPDLARAMVWSDRDHAVKIATQMGGEVAEAWESPAERLIRWGTWSGSVASQSMETRSNAGTTEAAS